jgi:hypothetical protein
MSRVVFGLTGEQIERVAHQREHSAKRGDGTARASGQVQDQRGTNGAAETAAQGGEWSLPATLGAHDLGNALEKAVANCPSGLGGDVAGADTGASGGNYQAGLGGGRAKCVFDGLNFVWY